MKVLFNGLLLNDKFTGVQYYAENIVKAITKLTNKEFQLSTLVSTNYKGSLRLANLQNSNIDTSNRLKRVAFENLFLGRYFKNENYDLLHSPNYVLPYNWKHPSVLTIHDLIALQFPHFCQTESAVYSRLLMPHSILKATQIITVSNKVKEDIIERFKISPENIHVIYHGINSHFKKITDKAVLLEIKQKYKLPEKYILFVGNIEPKKNLERLILSFHQLKSQNQLVHKMVLVGKNGWKYNEVFDLVRKLKLNNEILFTGYVPEEDLPAIYSSSDVFVFPSLYEGFGIPPLEAMACEVPVLASREGALPEVTGGNCMKVNAYEINDMAKGIFDLVTNESLRENLIDKGKMWVKKFTWEKAAKETLAVYNNAFSINPKCKKYFTS